MGKDKKMAAAQTDKGPFRQPELFEELVGQIAEITPELRMVPVGELPEIADLRCDPPGPELQQSVSLWRRVFQPIGLVGDAETGYDLAWGRRRTWAAIKAGLTEVPALIYPVGTPIWALTLIENNARGENAQSDAWAISQGVAASFNADEIGALGGVNKGTMKRRLTIMTGLTSDLLVAWQGGKIRDTTAEVIAKMRPEQQNKLVDVLNANGKITLLDAEKVKRLASVAATVKMQPGVLTPLDVALHAATGSEAPVVAGPGDEAVADSRGQAMGLLIAARACLLDDPDKAAIIALDRVVEYLETGEWKDTRFVWGLLHNTEEALAGSK